MFTGYTDQTVDVFWGIRFNNDRAWFAEHKQEFQDAVMTPTKALAGDLYDWFQEAYPDLHLNVHISRIYRDARRLFGRGPVDAGSIRRTAAAASGQRPEARRKAPAAAGRAAGIYAFRPRLCKAEGPCRGTGWKTL